MRILVTGINGFVGLHLSKLLVEKGHDVTGTRIDDLNLDILSQHLSPEKVAVCDITRVDQVEGLFDRLKPEGIFHLAGQSWVPASWTDPKSTFETNLIGSINIFNATVGHVPDSRCVFISTGDFYDVANSPDAAAGENSAVMPRNPYALSKMTADMVAWQYFVSKKLQVIRIRPFNHIGPYQSERFVVSEFAKQIALAEEGIAEPVLRVGNLDAERDFTDVRDMVRAYDIAMRECVPGECYNVSSQNACSIQGILDILLSKSRVDIAVEPDPRKYRPVEIARFLGNSEKFRSLTGWGPDIPIEKTVIDVLDYWREKVKDGKA